jgi:hypothetical protein
MARWRGAMARRDDAVRWRGAMARRRFVRIQVLLKFSFQSVLFLFAIFGSPNAEKRKPEYVRNMSNSWALKPLNAEKLNNVR